MKKNSSYCFLMILGLFPSISHGLPTMEEVVSGDVTISSPDSQSMVVKASDRAIIQYQDFSIGLGEKVQFIQPKSSSVVLNRVTGDNPSSIFGSLSSNGKVFLVNANGIYFGPSAEVNVGSLIASTLDITNQDFLEGRWSFKEVGLTSSLSNQGSIQAETDVILIGSKIINEGQLVAKVGKVAIGAGEKVTLNFAQDKMISFSMEGILEEAEIVNLGRLEAAQGEVLLSVNTARKIIDSLINVDALSSGSSIIEEGGKIFLKETSSLLGKTISILGGESSFLSIEGEVLATDKISFSGNEVVLGRSLIQSPGGEIAINASQLFLDPFSVVSTSAVKEGDGGYITFRANKSISLEGTLLARGGDLQGDGGLVKVYSEGELDIGSVLVDTGAFQGEMGTWVFNPESLEGMNITSHVSHLHIILRGDGKIISPITLEQEQASLTLEASHREATLYLGANLSTQGGRILVRSPLQLLGNSPIYIDSQGADIIFKGIVDGSDLSADFILEAGVIGSIQFKDSLGVTVPLASVRVNKSQAIYLSNNLVTSGKSIEFHAPVHLTVDSKIDTTAGGSWIEGSDILLWAGVSGNQRLHLDAGLKGVITVENGIGVHGSALSAISMRGSAIHLTGDVRADGGTIIYNGPVYLSSDAIMTDTGPTGIIFLSTLNSIGSARSLTLSAPIGKVLFLGEVGGVNPMHNISVSSNSIGIKSDMTLDGQLLLEGAVSLLDDVVFIAAGITSSKTIDGPYDLTLNVGSSGSVLLQNHVGKGVRVGDFRIVNAAIVVTEAIYANTILQDSGSSITTFNGVLDTIYQGGIELTGTDFTLISGIKTSNGGSLLVDQSGVLTIEQAMELSGSFSQISIGNVEISGDITTNQKDISFIGHVMLLGPISLSTGEEGPGSVSLADVDSPFGSPYSLDLTIGRGDLLFADTVGAIGPLGDILINSARNVTASSIRSLSYTQLEGGGTGSYAGNITSTGDLGIYIFSNYLDFAGESSGKLLTTLGNGNMMLNSIYGELGSALNPIKISLRDGLGTVYEGDFGVVYFSSDVNQVANICAVRSNRGCQVLYSIAGAPYKDVTPNNCCNNIPPIPPPPPPPPGPTPSGNHLPKGPLLYYIPGIYTNYWSFKDTLGSPWYFTVGCPTRWWDAMPETCYCRAPIEGPMVLSPYCDPKEPSVEINIQNQTAITQEVLAQALNKESVAVSDNSSQVSKQPEITQDPEASSLWKKLVLLFSSLVGIGGYVLLASRNRYQKRSFTFVLETFSRSIKEKILVLEEGIRECLGYFKASKIDEIEVKTAEKSILYFKIKNLTRYIKFSIFYLLEKIGKYSESLPSKIEEVEQFIRVSLAALKKKRRKCVRYFTPQAVKQKGVKKSFIALKIESLREFIRVSLAALKKKKRKCVRYFTPKAVKQKGVKKSFIALKVESLREFIRVSLVALKKKRRKCIRYFTLQMGIKVKRKGIKSKKRPR